MRFIIDRKYFLQIYLFLIGLNINAQDLIVQSDLGLKIDIYLTLEEEKGFSGTVLIERSDKVILKNGYGFTDSTNTYHITPKTNFFVASITKGFTGISILQLVQNNKLKLNQKLSDFFDNVPKEFSGTTLHQLLIHTSGLGNNYGGTAIKDRNDAVKDIFSYPSEFPSGSDFLYSNDGYSLLAAVVEVDSGSTYEEYV